METLLSIRNLGLGFESGEGFVNAVNGIGINLDSGQTLGLVGESDRKSTRLNSSH